MGTYSVKATHDGFDTTQVSGIAVREASASTINVSLKIGKASESVEVTANPMLNATDATNGYTLDAAQIADHASGHRQLHAARGAFSRRQC